MINAVYTVIAKTPINC